MPHSHAITRRTRKALKFNTLEGTFAVASDHMAAPYLGLFALALGATPSQIGMLNAFPALLGNILQIPYGLLAEKYGKRRLMVLAGGSWLRASWLLVAFLPFLLPPQMAVAAVIFLATLRITIGSLGTPAWISIQADLVPAGIRGKYYANRNVVQNFAGLGATVVAGQILGLTFPWNYQTLFVLSSVFGLTAAGMFMRIPLSEERQESVQQRPHGALHRRLKNFVGTIRSDANFASYCFSSLVWNFGVSISGPLVAVYFIRTLEGPEGVWAVVTGASIGAGILCQRYWGRLADRFGQKNVMSIAGIGAVIIPLLWFSIPHYALAVAVNFWAGMSWAGYNLAAFNLLLEITPGKSRSMYAGVFNTLMGLATAAGPLVGGFLAEVITLRMVFLLSLLMRALGLYIFNRRVDNPSDKRIASSDLVPAWTRQLRSMIKRLSLQ